MKSTTRLVTVILLLSAHALYTRAQTITGSITGRITDATGAVIPNAMVQLTEQHTNVSVSTKVLSDGNFTFPDLLPGDYSITVEATGFKRLVQQHLVLTASERLSTGTLKLEVGSVTQSITVTAAATPIQTTSSELSGNIDVHQIDNELSIGGDWMSLLRTIPGVSETSTGPEGSGSLGGSTTPYVNGVRNIYNNTQLDGMSASPRPGQGVDASPNNYSVAEIKVETAGYEAQYGSDAPGVNIQVVTKNGTNQFHGSAYYFNRNEDYNANSWFDNFNGVPRSRYRYNRIGGNIGGPIFIPGHFNKGRNKLFFFYSEEYWPISSPVIQEFMMPTQAQVNGDFSQTPEQGIVNPSPATQYINIKMPGEPISSCAATGTTGSLSGCWDYNGKLDVINPADINPNSQYFVNLLYQTATTQPGWIPETNTSVTKGNYNYIFDSTADNPTGQQIARIDYDPTEKLRMYANILFTQSNNNAYNSAANDLKWLMKVNYYTPRADLVYDITYTFSPTLLNEFNIGRSYFKESQLYTQSQLALATKSSSGYNLPQLYPADNPLNLLPAVGFGSSNLSNAPSYGWDSRFPMHDVAQVYQITDNLTKVIRSHSLMFGFQFLTGHYLQAHSSSGTPEGSISFSPDSSNINDSYYGYANAVEGLFDTYSEPTRRDDYNPGFLDPEWFAQDSWRLNPKLTLNYGARFMVVPANTLEIGGNFVPALYSASQAPTLYGYAPGGQQAINPLTGQLYPKAYAGDFVPNTGNIADGLISTLSHSGYPSTLINGTGFHVSPRVGFSYDPLGNGKMAIRGNFGAFLYPGQVEGQAGDMTHEPPIEYQPEQFYGNIGGITGGSGLLSPSSFGAAFEEHPQQVAIYSYALQIQQEIGFGTVFTIGYDGNVQRHMTGSTNINEIPYYSQFLPQNNYCASASGCTAGAANSGYEPLPTVFYVPYPGYNTITYRTTTYNGNYNSLQVSLLHHYANGLEFDLAYTWSKAMDFADEYDSGVATYEPIRFWNYGPESETPQQNLAINYLYALPNVRNSWSNFFTKPVLNGWQLTGIVTYFDKIPSTLGGYSTVDSVVGSGSGGGDGLRNLVSGNFNSGGLHHKPNNFASPTWFNINPVSRPTTGVYDIVTGQVVPSNGFTGNEATIIYPPGFWNFDTALFKDFKIHDRVTFQLRVETYNTFNSPEFNGVNTGPKFSAFTGGQTIPTLYGPTMINGASTQTNAAFGELSGTASEAAGGFGRVMQLAGRINF
jgi:hypothetical protein